MLLDQSVGYTRSRWFFCKLNLPSAESRPLAGTLACEEPMTSIVFWPLTGALEFVVLLIVARYDLISQVGKRDDA